MKREKELLVFIVDDDPVYTKALVHYLTEEIPSLKAKIFTSGEACVHVMEQNPEAVILDYYLDSEFPDAWNGIETLEKLSWNYPNTDVVLLTVDEHAQTAMEGLRKGAIDYVVKDEHAFLKIKNILLDIKDNETEAQGQGENKILNTLNIVLFVVFIAILVFRQHIK